MRQRRLVAVSIKICILCVLLVSSRTSLSSTQEEAGLSPLPEPLTLEYALSQVDIIHPDSRTSFIYPHLDDYPSWTTLSTK